jgi:hypothetical protein
MLLFTYEILYENENGEQGSHADGPDIHHIASNSLEEFNEFCNETMGDHLVDIHEIKKLTTKELIDLKL